MSILPRRDFLRLSSLALSTSAFRGFNLPDFPAFSSLQSPAASSPISPAPVTNYKSDYSSPAYVSNGMVGLRVPKFALLNGACTINGFVGMTPSNVEGWVMAPYPVGGDIRIGQHWLSWRPDLAIFKEQSYDFASGELHTSFSFKVGSTTASVKIFTFCSRTLPTLALQEISVTVDQPCELRLRALININSGDVVNNIGPQGKLLDKNNHVASFHGEPVVDGYLLWESIGGLSKLGMAYASIFVGDGEATQEKSADAYGTGLHTEYVIAKALPGKTYRIRQITSCVPQLLHPEPHRQATRMAYLGKDQGFEKIRLENRHAWAEIWKGRVKLLGAEQRWQAMADAAYFYLHTSVHAQAQASTGLLGLSKWYNYHYFNGHAFWDIETFMLPPLLLTAPESARSILSFRSRNLQAAQANAALNGYNGIQFPWESGINGQEVTPPSWPVIIYEQHINMDVAFAFAQYVHATGDELFLRQKAWPVLQGVAEWITSRVTKTGRGYEIRQVMGICEGEVSDNNAYVNIAAQVVLKEAMGFAQALGYSAPKRWKDIAENIVIPVHRQRGLVQRHDSYDFTKGDCTETLAAFYPYTYRHSPAVDEATYRHYLQRGQEAQGMPMLPPLLPVFAARLKDRKGVKALLEKGVADYFFEPFMQMDEFGKTRTENIKEKVGPYLAHAGAFMMDCLYGLTGMQINSGDPSSWFTYPVTMPEGWDGIEVERIWVRGEAMRLIARHGDKQARLEPIK